MSQLPTDQHRSERPLTQAEADYLTALLTPIFQRVIDRAHGEGPLQLAKKNRGKHAKNSGPMGHENARIPQVSRHNPATLPPVRFGREVADSRES